MSIRPSSQVRAQAVLPANTSYVVIGDTSLAVIYATKLYESFKDNGTFPNIYLLTSGNDNTVDVNVEGLDYISRNNQTIYKTLKNTLVHLVLASNEPVSSSLATDNIIFEQFYQYFSGSGPLGDMVTEYYTPFVGPFFQTDSRSRLENFVKSSTIQKDLTTNEFNVMNNIALIFNLAKTTSVISTKPSILTVNYIMVYNERSKLERQIYRDLYVDLTTPSSVNIATHVTNIKIAPTDSCLSSVEYSTISGVNPVIPNACVLYMCNLYSYAQITGMNNLNHKKIIVPVFYRCVFSMDKVTPYVNLTNLDPNVYPLNIGDGLTTRLAFTCTDVPNPGEKLNYNVSTWDVVAYTTDEDFSNPGGTYADTSAGKTLLIIEAISLMNRRVYAWDSLNSAVSVELNSNSVELGTYNKFLLIAANVYQCYTGVPPLLPIGAQSVCNNGICTDFFGIEHTSSRESPLQSTLRLLSSLYGNATYPTPNNLNASNCCG